MKPIPPDGSDPPLGGVLKEWQVKASLPPRFQERVWKRIALAEAPAAPRSGVLAWLDGLQALLSRPGLAAGYVAVLLALGFGLGWVRGLEKSAQIDETLSSRYVQVMDPYQSVDR